MSDIPNSLKKMLKTARVKHFPKGQIIIYVGDPSTELLVLKEGIVKVHDIDEHGNEKVLHIVKPPAVMPFIFFAGNGQSATWFYTSVTDCEVYVVSSQELIDVMKNDGELTLFLLNWYSREMHELLVRLSSMGKTITRDKLVAALKFLAVCHSESQKKGWRHVSFPVSHQLIADMTGITRESAAIGMKELEDEKIIRYPKITTLEVHFEKLAAK